MSALLDSIFPGSAYSKCLHLEIDPKKSTYNMTTVRDCETSQVIVSCSQDCAKELFSMVTLDAPLCTKCSSNVKSDNYHTITYGGNKYTIYLCETCKDTIISDIAKFAEVISCDGCGKETKTRCVCLKVGYCSKDCQIKKRSTHKLECYKANTN
jgi:hypothetical protein